MGFMDLFRPKWQHCNWSVREVAVEKLTDQGVLAEAATHDPDESVRLAAVEKMENQGIRKVMPGIMRTSRISMEILRCLNRPIE